MGGSPQSSEMGRGRRKGGPEGKGNPQMGKDDADGEAKWSSFHLPSLPSAKICVICGFPFPFPLCLQEWSGGVLFGGKEIPKWLCRKGRVCEGRSSLRS